MQDIFKQLKNSRETEIDLSNIGITNENMKILAQAISYNSYVRKIDLSSNHISETGAFALSQALKNNGTIIELDLSANEINERGCNYLVNRKKNHPTLKQLVLENQKISQIIHFSSFSPENNIIQEKNLLMEIDVDISDKDNMDIDVRTPFRKNMAAKL
jgi:Ran GTPase-activating protein (RanGAP) involved in mRNA processing and transport